MAVTNCRHFSGYKPCGLNADCNEACPHKSVPRFHILVVHLEALGAVLRATSVLPAIRRKYVDCHITWVTQAPAQNLLKNNPYIDRVLTTSSDDLLKLKALEFDIGFCIDKSLKAVGVISNTQVDQLFGFTATASGAIVPASEHANELWELGLSDHKKFFVNKKPETQLMTEALDLDYKRDNYQLQLTKEEQEVVRFRKKQWASNKEILIGINTGCAPTIPYKKFTVYFQRQIIQALKSLPNTRVVLLGGPEDTQRNKEIGRGFDLIESPTEAGLRDGFCSVAACDLVISGDSLGMHMAIALEKWVVAWFGPTCAHEIDLFGRGEKLLTAAPCSPCWKRSCQKKPMCYDLVELGHITEAVKRGIQWLTSSSKQHLSETSSSPSLY